MALPPLVVIFFEIMVAAPLLVGFAEQNLWSEQGGLYYTDFLMLLIPI